MAERDTRIDRLLLGQEITDFLYREAELLDERRYREWLDLLADDVRYSMPPLPEWYRGVDDVRAFLLDGPLQLRWRFLPTTANGQLAFGTYLWDETERSYVPGGLDILAIRNARVTEVTAFLTADLTRFGLPARIAPDPLSGA